jgi:hypothetical protein
MKGAARVNLGASPVAEQRPCQVQDLELAREAGDVIGKEKEESKLLKPWKRK